MKYYIAIKNQPVGPFELNQLLDNGLVPDSLVWFQGQTSWVKASDVPELQSLFFNSNEPPAFDERQYQWYISHRSNNQNIPFGANPSEFKNSCAGNGYNPQGSVPQPNNFLGEAIVVTVLCFLPLGVIALIKAIKSNNFYNQGRYAEAEAYARSARNWVVATVVVGVVFWLSSLLF